MAVEINDVTDKTIRKKNTTKNQKKKQKTKKEQKKKNNSHCDMKPPYNLNKAKTYKVYFEVRWKGEFG